MNLRSEVRPSVDQFNNRTQRRAGMGAKSNARPSSSSDWSSQTTRPWDQSNTRVTSSTRTCKVDGAVMSGEWVDDHSEPILHFFNAEKNPVMGFNQRLSEVEDRLLAVIQAPIAIMRKLGSG